MKVIVLTGGGTSGHVTPNIALLPMLKDKGYTIYYIGSKNGIEKQLIEKEGIPYYGISAGKLRRYLDVKNVTDMFRIIAGFGQALSVLRKIKPSVVFSKGGFVSCLWSGQLGYLGFPLLFMNRILHLGLPINCQYLLLKGSATLSLRQRST